MLMVETIGTISVLGGEEKPRVMLCGTAEDVRSAGHLYGLHVSIAQRGAAGYDGDLTRRMADALVAGLLVQRRYLRSLIELGCRDRDGAFEVGIDNPPREHSLDASSRPYVADALVAIREAESVLQEYYYNVDLPTLRDDDAPAWLDKVIDGEIEI